MWVNGRRARKGTTVSPGDEIRLELERVTPPALAPIDGPLTIVHLDQDLVAIDKPPGVPSVGGASPTPSVAAILLARFPEMAAIDRTRGGGLLHRLDTGTSGLLLAARHPAAYERLRGEFRRQAVRKTYLAVVHGRVAHAGTIDQPLRHRRGRGGRVVAAGTDGRRRWRAVTSFQPLRAGEARSLVQLEMRTGFTHQLRAHMALLGHPVVADRRYGPPPGPDTGAHGWHYLHAVEVGFDTPGLPARLTTAFPGHWEALCARTGWPARR